jgi:hypothetical protein
MRSGAMNYKGEEICVLALNLPNGLHTGQLMSYKLVMESSLARLGSGLSRFFLLLLEKLEPKKSAGLIWLN